MKFIDVLNMLIDEKGISVNQMAKELNLGSGTFATWRKRGTVPSGETLQKLSDYFGVTTDFLLNGPQPTENQHSQPEISLLEQEIMERGPSLPKEERDRLLGILNSTIDAYLEATKDDNKKRR